MEILQLGGAIAVLLGIYLYGKHSLYGPIISAVGCIDWAIAGMAMDSWALALLNVILFAMHIYNLGLWYNGLKHAEIELCNGLNNQSCKERSQTEGNKNVEGV